MAAQQSRPFDNFEHSGTPATNEEYVTYREKTQGFIEKRSGRMAEEVTEHHPEIEVRRLVGKLDHGPTRGQWRIVPINDLAPDEWLP